MVSPEDSIGNKKRRRLRDWLGVSRKFKLFPIRWKWRRTRMYQIMTTVVILFLVISFSPLTFCEVLNSYNNPNTRQLRIQNILNNLTPAETRAIFGNSETSHDIVPRLDIISPTVCFGKCRRKRSTSKRSEIEMSEKVVTLEGLGRAFELTLTPTSSLLNLNEFVHLFRHENYTEILPDNIVRQQLPCFHHGTVEHQSVSAKKEGVSRDNGDVKKGLVALDTCNGSLKGFIVPVEKDPTEYHHYVFHPVPKRFRNPNKSRDMLPEHFIWKRQSLETSVNDQFNYHHRYPSRPQSFCGHDDSDNHQPRTLASRHLPRSKRSQLSLEDDDGDKPLAYRYKPQNVAVDSYWLRHRSTIPPPADYSRRNDYRHRPTVRQGHLTPQKQRPSADYWTPTQGGNYDDREQSTYRNADLERSATSYRTAFPFLTGQGTGSDTQYYYNSSQTRIGHSHRSKVNDDRQGRGDNTVFGEPYHSSLDSDLLSTAQSDPAQTRVVNDLTPAHLTIETAVFVDKDLYEHMQSNFPDDTQSEVSRIVLAMINAVQLLYQDTSLGHRVEFVLKRLEILATDPPGLVRPYDIDRFLTNFCKWQKTENPASDADPLHWDHALILTGLDLYVVHQSGKISNQVVGLAPVAGMCTRSSSCTVNEGRHFESVYVMAHEIGHNLGMRHDGPQAENECDPTAHIMSPTLGSGKITWSPCSKRYLDMFLETSQSKCLLDKAKSETRLDHDADQRLPGERFNANQQCVLKYGRGSFHATQQPMEDVCRDLHCRKEYYTWTSHPALEGTECGLEMSCRAGKCVSKSQVNEVGLAQTLSGSSSDAAGHLTNHLGSMDGSETAAYSTLKALDGAWGKWSPFTDCSSACLYADDSSVTESSTGIRLAARRCDSPRPENSGRQCSGLDRRYKTCSTEKICPSTLPKTSTSQYANEVCVRAAAVDTELSGRGFMSTSTNDPERACSVWCEIAQGTGSRSRGWSFPDGTACKLSARTQGSHFCIAGNCQGFTCDGNSHFVLSDDLCTVPVPKSITAEPSSWFGNRVSSRTSQGSDSTYRQEKSFWTKWEPQSTCKLACLAPSKGLQLVQRKCNLEDNKGSSNPGEVCTGLSLSVRLCKPDKSTILSNACTRFQTVFEHATKLCTKYAEKVTGLSGIGMQLSPTKDDSHRPCRIGCQDASLPYRFYMVNGDEGWFPAGTDCSRGEPNKKAYCLSGKCVDFGPDDTPMYRINPKVIGRLESILRSKRTIADESQQLSKENNVMDQSSLQQLVDRFATQTEVPTMPDESIVDFGSPVVVTESDQDYDISEWRPIEQKENLTLLQSSSVGTLEVEGSFYEWQKVVSDCSTRCGPGLQEVVVQCISGGTIVSDIFCEGAEKPGSSSYISCHLRSCTQADFKIEQSHNFLWTWVQSMLLHHRNQTHT